ncbi:MAG: TSUP family transporter [Aureispira sp.]|nr:TSUP family transporter [Aureispira sp.]
MTIFIASFINSTFGFGNSIVSMLLLTLFLPLETAAPLVAILSISIHTFIAINDFKNIQWRSILILLLAALLTIPLGVNIGANTNIIFIKLSLAILIISFSLYNLLATNSIHLQNEFWAILFGGISGFFGGAYNITGPPIVLYASLRQWKPEVFRVTLQAYFSITTLFIVMNYWKKGAYTPIVWEYFSYGVPAMLIAIFLGKWANQKIKNPIRFNKYIYILMLILAALLIVDLF